MDHNIQFVSKASFFSAFVGALSLALAAQVSAAPITVVTNLDDALYVPGGFITDHGAGKGLGVNATLSPGNPLDVFIKFANDEAITIGDLPPFNDQERPEWGSDVDVSGVDRTYQLQVALTDKDGNTLSPFLPTPALDAIVHAGVGNAGFGFALIPDLLAPGDSLTFYGLLFHLTSTADTFVFNPSSRVRGGFRADSFERGAAVPLPGALPLFAGGLGVMGLFGWRKKRKAKLAA
jgi:hypothetical protein